MSVNASKEYGLEKALAKMHADWDGLEFRIIEYKDTGTYIVGGTDEIQVTRPMHFAYGRSALSHPLALLCLCCVDTVKVDWYLSYHDHPTKVQLICLMLLPQQQRRLSLMCLHSGNRQRV